MPLIASIEMGGRRLPVHWRAVEQRKVQNEYTTDLPLRLRSAGAGAEIGLAGISRPRTY